MRTKVRGIVMAYDRKEYMQKYRQDHKKERKEYDYKYYHAHIEEQKKYRQDHKENQHKHYQKRRDWYYKNISELFCADCGMSFENIPEFAEFHHIFKKANGMSGMLGIVAGSNYNVVVEELNKGIFLCPNCHRIRHLYPLDKSFLRKETCLNSEQT